MANTTNTATITVRLKPRTLEQLRELAAREDRSIGAEVRRAVTTHVKSYQPKERER